MLDIGPRVSADEIAGIGEVSDGDMPLLCTIAKELDPLSHRWGVVRYVDVPSSVIYRVLYNTSSGTLLMILV